VAWAVGILVFILLLGIAALALVAWSVLGDDVWYPIKLDLLEDRRNMGEAVTTDPAESKRDERERQPAEFESAK
jgi:hypothetical protein